MQLQKGLTFRDSNSFPNLWNSMMVCSAIENIKFAVSHKSSRGKYLIRVFDALKRIKPISSSESNATNVDLNEMFLSFKKTLYNELTGIIKTLNHDTFELLRVGMDTEDNILAFKVTGNIDELKMTKKDYEPLKKQLTEALSRISDSFTAQYPNHDLFITLQDKVISEANKIVRFIDNLQVGGKTNFKKMLKDGKVVKKSVLGRERVIYVNSKRKQFIKSQGEFKSISSLQKKKT